MKSDPSSTNFPIDPNLRPPVRAQRAPGLGGNFDLLSVERAGTTKWLGRLDSETDTIQSNRNTSSQMLCMKLCLFSGRSFTCVTSKPSSIE